MEDERVRLLLTQGVFRPGNLGYTDNVSVLMPFLGLFSVRVLREYVVFETNNPGMCQVVIRDLN